MESFPIFFTVRTVTFASIVILAFVWLVLLSVEVFIRWNISDDILQSLMTLLILTNGITILVPPILLILEFRVWLDAARLLLLLVLQIGAATAFTYFFPKIHCPSQTPDDVGICKLLNTYTVMASWVIPVILVLYTAYFTLMVYLQSRIPVAVEPTKSDDHFVGRPSVLPLMDPEMAEWRPSRASGSSSESDPGPKARVDSTQPTRPLLPLLLPQRQSALPVYNQPVSMSPHRHRSLPAMHHPAGRSHPRRTMTLTVPAPLAPQAQFYPVPPLPVTLQSGVTSRPVVRHLSMMPPPRRGRSSSDAGNSPLSESPSSRSVLSKPIPSYLM
ncbi:hypothetical protein J3A83DRAFT_4256700 [Scleroderma citrinum]